MIGASQGFFGWPGIASFLHGSFSFTHGITPSLCQIYIAPQPFWPDMAGDLTVNYQPGGDSYTFTDCILDFISIERGADGRQIWGLHILDRRWKWKDCGRISGNYNIRRGQGDGESNIWTPSVRTLPELMELCLNAMGEDVYGFDLSQVSAEDFPEVEWDYENPAKALLSLCDQYGYRVILTLQNTVLIAPANEGEYLPDGRYMSGGTTINPPNTPSSVVATAGRTIVQYDFPLEAVGLEIDGTVVPIYDLSYTPNKPNGWADLQGDLEEMTAVDKPFRGLALKSVFRWYRILPPFTFFGIDPNNSQNEEVSDRIFVLPLLDVQVDQAPETPDTPATPLAAWVYGIWSTTTLNQAKNNSETFDSSMSVPDETQGFYPYEFELDHDQGIVKFSDPTFAYDPNNPDDKSIYPAEVFLRTSCNIRDQQTMGWLRYEQQQYLQNGQIPTLPMYVKHDDTSLKVAYRFAPDGSPIGADDNLNDVQAACDWYLGAAVGKLTVEDPQSFEYPGFVFIDLDGAIQQLEWNVDESGKATTKANRNKEDLVNTPSYEEAKQAARLQMALANGEKLGRIKQQDNSQNLTVS